jgi:hypothetical protein
MVPSCYAGWTGQMHQGALLESNFADLNRLKNSSFESAFSLHNGKGTNGLFINSPIDTQFSEYIVYVIRTLFILGSHMQLHKIEK